MKTSRFLQLAAGAMLAMALTFFGCDEGGGGVKKSNLKSNEFIGSIPSIYVDFNNGMTAAKNKKDADEAEAIKKKNDKKYDAAKETYTKTTNDLRAKYEAAKKSEWEKLKGKAVPFTMSDEFKALKIDVKSVTVDGDKGGFSANIVATEDLKLNYTNGHKYSYLKGYFLAKDGSTIAEHRFFINTYMTQVIVKAGQPLYHDGGEVPSGAINYNEKWADIASIKFVSEDDN